MSSRMIMLCFVYAAVLVSAKRQSTDGKYGMARYHHQCLQGGKQCQYTVTLPECMKGDIECSSAETPDQAILNNLLELVSEQTTQIRQLCEAVQRLTDSKSEMCRPCNTWVPYKDCYDVANDSRRAISSGIYQIQPDGISSPFDVYCEIFDTETWTVIQRRINGSVDFYRKWDEYKSGFGYIDHEYWFGNDNIHALTTQASYRLRIDLEDWDNSTSYAEYDSFWIEDETSLYILHLGNYSGTAGDAMKNTYAQQANLDGHPFSTNDRDNDDATNHECAVQAQGAWWYNSCQLSNLNGLYRQGGTPPTDYSGVRWNADGNTNQSWKTVVMKVQSIQ